MDLRHKLRIKHRDHDMSELDDPHLVELMRKGTIPPSLSLRAPPTHIGTSNHRNDVLGITKEEISKRYIIKLQKDRVRNNEAVYKSLDNLPIKIRQFAQKSFDIGTESSTSSFRSREPDESNTLPKVYTNQQCAKSLDSPWNKNNGINPRKPKAKVKICPKGDNFEVVKPKIEDQIRRVTFEPHTLNMLHSEMPYIFSSGFQGYQNRLRISRKKPIAFGQTVNSSQDFQKRYQRVLDSNQQPHFVKTSLIKGQRVNNNYHRFRTVSNQPESEHSEELYAIKSVQRINEPLIFTSPASPTRVPNPSLYSECQNSDMSLNVNGIAASPPSRAASSTFADQDSCDNSSRGDPDNDISQTDKNNIADSTELSGNNGRPNDTAMKPPVLSSELLRVHENATSAQTKKTYGACNLTDITERDESNLTKTSRSEVGQDMKISVRINYRSKEDAIEEHHSNVSASSNKSKDSLTTKHLRHNNSSESKRSGSTLSEKPLDNLRIEGRLYGEYSDVEKHSTVEVVTNSVDRERDDGTPPSEEKEIPRIIVDLNRLKTVKTPIRKKKSHNELINNEKTELKRSTMESERNNMNEQTEFIPSQTDDKGDFFITYEENDSALSHYADSVAKSPKFDEPQAVEMNGVKDTSPRTEIDDSGISISTFENEAIRC